MSNTRKLFESFQNNLNEYDEEEEEIFDNVHEDNYKFGDVNYKLPSGKYIHFHNESNGEGYYYAIYENGKEVDGGTLLYSEIDAKPQTERDILKRLAELSDLPEIAEATEKVDQEVIDSFDESALNEVGEGHTYDFVYGGDYDEFKVDGKTVYKTSYVKRNVPVYSDDKEELRKHAENIFSEMIENAKAEYLVMIERDRAINTIYDYLLQHNYNDEEPIEESINEEYGDDYKDLPEFHSAFQITRNIIFFVNYYRLGNNKYQDFSTSVDELMRNKRDISSGGQAQDRLLPQGSLAKEFYEKWDHKHLHYMTEEEYNEMRSDLDKLKNAYNYIEQESDIRFSQEVELSKEPMKKSKNMNEDVNVDEINKKIQQMSKNLVNKWKDYKYFVCDWCGTTFTGKIDSNGIMPPCPHCLEDRYKNVENKLDDGYANKDVHFYNPKTKETIYTDYEGNETDNSDLNKDLPFGESANINKEDKEMKLEEARLTDYLGILEIRDLLQKNKETADKEFAIIDDMKVEVGTGDDLKIYKATKGVDGNWELTLIKESAKPLTTKGLMESLHSIKEDYEDDDYEDEEDIYTKAENWDGNLATDELEDYEWKEVLDNAPEVYKQALRAREEYVKDSWGEIPELVWNEIESLIDEGAFGGESISPGFIVDNIIINGDYGDFDNYKEDNETDEEFVSRVEDSVFAIFPDERFVIFSL